MTKQRITEYQRLAKRLNELVERPQFAGRKWDWVTIGSALNISAAKAQALIQWMRLNTTDMYWTIGTHATGYQIVPTKALRDALDGLLNQMKHQYTRDLSQARAFEVLSKVDPDPFAARVCARMARFFTRRAEDLSDQLDAMRERQDIQEQARTGPAA